MGRRRRALAAGWNRRSGRCTPLAPREYAIGDPERHANDNILCDELNYKRLSQLYLWSIQRGFPQATVLSTSIPTLFLSRKKEKNTRHMWLRRRQGPPGAVWKTAGKAPVHGDGGERAGWQTGHHTVVRPATRPSRRVCPHTAHPSPPRPYTRCIRWKPPAFPSASR